MPGFGRSLLDDFLLDPSLTYLNHGTVGVTHRSVLAAQRAIVDEIERNPARFLLRETADPELVLGREPRIRQALAPVARFVGADPADMAFVDNITTGVNAILRSYPLRAGDEILVTDLGYGGVTNAAVYAARTAGATVRTATLPWPATDVSRYVEAVEAAIGPATRLLVIDHLSAQTALLLPLADIAAVCHRHGVLVLADGAHVPGNVPLDIPSLGVDWYVANLHKWAFAPRSCGVLWVSPAQRGHLHAAVISWGLDNGLAAEFDLPGTRDPSAWLAAPAGLGVLHGYGLEAVYAHNHDLAWWAGAYLSDCWGTSFSTPREMIGAMATVRLPKGLSEESDLKRVQMALFGRSIEVPVFARAGSLWTRVSAQVYNDRADIETLADAVTALAP